MPTKKKNPIGRRRESPARKQVGRSKQSVRVNTAGSRQVGVQKPKNKVVGSMKPKKKVTRRVG